ncbi:hypothetical protein [Arsenicibacter rosenii]|uniref:Uncharacterized protein n=1 Tax=Arsenicibacter rosenii TaxID=1750698 RepID=A0A1S2VJQ9_9BACT|nr:hypothetical protein [Arsenicibacter rosenii]OIN59001.1 hypothetical protein BLX24_12360 [Arsenicibacter rosenii]
MKSRVIFASLILGLGLMITKASAATTITDDSPASKTPASAMLVNGTEKQFAAYVEQKAQLFSQGNDWQNFMRVVSLYNNNPVSVLSVSAADRDKFNEAASQVTKALAKQPANTETVRWIKQADFTKRVINYLWSTETQIQEATDL